MQGTTRPPTYRGMQVHAVPESDRAFDASGRRLPWGYDISASPNAHEAVERGPFGRSARRSRSGLSRSRSKTAEPKREEDRVRAEQVAAEDAVFGSLRRGGKAVDGEGEGAVGAQQVAPQSVEGDGEASEVLLFGFGEDLQWAATDHYERVSGGEILEDYERQPAGTKYDVSRSLGRATSQRSLSRAALKKKNTYAGGLHWIKVTFSSRAAAELACARSPHVIKGHLVYAEPYLGRGPGKDEPIVATQAGAQITDSALPSSFSTATPGLEGSPNGSSTTATSATATTRPQTGNGDSQASTSTSQTLQSPFASLPASQMTTAMTPGSKANTQGALTRRRRLSNTTRMVVLPASAALLPKQPQKSLWTRFLGGGELIGSTVPKTDDGAFDWEKASVYWRVFYWIDTVFKTDFCGMRGD